MQSSTPPLSSKVNKVVVGLIPCWGGQRSILMVNQIQCEMKAQEEYNHCTKLDKLLNTKYMIQSSAYSNHNKTEGALKQIRIISVGSEQSDG